MLKRASLLLLLLLGTGAFLAPAGSSPGAQEGRERGDTPTVMVITVESVIGPVSAEFITRKLEKAQRQGVEALVMELDTPGGLDTSMRSIIKEMNASTVPVAVYVAPPGARAASAGTFITIAAHVAAMAPRTNIGAAHPVAMGGKMDETMAEKVANDAAAYIRSLAESRGRNARWAEDAVRKSVSVTEEEALKNNVIDFVAPDVQSLLAQMDGMTVETAAGEKRLNTAGAHVVREEMGFRYKVLDFLSNPNVAYMLMILGFYGIFFEMVSPGTIFPGVVGAISLILAFYSLQTLPVNYAGLLLVLLAIVLFILETQVTSFGALTIGGIISMTIGSLMLFEAGPFFKLSLSVVVTAVALTAGFFTIVIGLIIKAHKARPSTGLEGLVGLRGKAVTDITPRGGQVNVHGEIWSTVSDEHIAKGEPVTVESANGLKLKVRKTST
ncbi:MAG: nodulation protein NfeD [Nitrospirota bacterium]